jgi:hypothetical protein
MTTTRSENSEPQVDRLIRSLASDLKPVRRLASPVLRALVWLGFVVATGLVLSMIADLHALQQRLESTPDMWLAVTGSALTAVLAAIAAFKLSLPDAPRAWIWLPVPAAILWVAASGLGCLRDWLVPGTHVASLHETMHCLSFIVGFSVPFSLVLFFMLRQAFPLLPGLTAAAAGLAAAAAAATLLNLFHPFDAAAVDLLVHAVAVAAVIVAARVIGARAFTSANNSPRA